MVFTCNSSSSWTDSTVMPLSRLVQGGLWQPSQHSFFLSQERVPSWCRCFACLLLICCRWRPFLESREPAQVTASTAQAAQCPCKNNLCTSFVIIDRTQTHLKTWFENSLEPFLCRWVSCSLGHSHLLLRERTGSEIRWLLFCESLA